jgi:hypothetical protein
MKQIMGGTTMAKGVVSFDQVLIIIGFLLLAIVIFFAATKAFSLFGG